jgi:hypothetical protein
MVIDPSALTRVPDAARAKATEEMDARIAEAFGESAKSVDVSRLLEEVETATEAADAAAGEARALALDPRLTPDDVKLARREMDDAAFARDRLNEARKKLAERIETLKALEKERVQRADHERVSADRIDSPKRWAASSSPSCRSRTSFVRSTFATARLGGSTQRR